MRSSLSLSLFLLLTPRSLWISNRTDTRGGELSFLASDRDFSQGACVRFFIRRLSSYVRMSFYAIYSKFKLIESRDHKYRDVSSTRDNIRKYSRAVLENPALSLPLSLSVNARYHSAVIANARLSYVRNETWIIEARRPAASSRRHWCNGCRLLARIPAAAYRRGTREKMPLSVSTRRCAWRLRVGGLAAIDASAMPRFFPPFLPGPSLSLSLSAAPLPSAARHLALSSAPSTVCRPLLLCVVLSRSLPPVSRRGRSAYT